MNETYWLPLDVDAYLEVDYGHRWPETELSAQCLALLRHVDPITTLAASFLYECDIHICAYMCM